MLAEVALLKGALAEANQKMIDNEKKHADQGSAYENDDSPGDRVKGYGQPIGRFLQKWYVLAKCQNLENAAKLKSRTSCMTEET